MDKISGINLKGKTVLVRKSWFKPEFAGGDRRFKCEGGFGCSPDTSGTKVFGYFIADGEKCFIRRSDVERLETRRNTMKANEQSQHTPGPWTLSSATDDGYRRINSRDWGALAEVVVMQEGEGSLGFYISEQGEANARLIAAAPELLEACKMALGAFESNDCIDWNFLELAVAKAEGRS